MQGVTPNLEVNEVEANHKGNKSLDKCTRDFWRFVHGKRNNEINVKSCLSWFSQLVVIYEHNIYFLYRSWFMS